MTACEAVRQVVGGRGAGRGGRVPEKRYILMQMLSKRIMMIKYIFNFESILIIRMSGVAI